MSRNPDAVWRQTPDRSVLDHMIGHEMAREGRSDPETVSPDLARRHTKPEDYLTRTLKSIRAVPVLPSAKNFMRRLTHHTDKNKNDEKNRDKGLDLGR